MTQRFAVLVPLKSWTRGKSRLGLGDPALRQRLVRAFAEDTIAAVLACPAVAVVYVVTAEPSLLIEGTAILPDEGGGDLNEALRAAARRTGVQHPELGTVALCADLPCLVTEDLTTALSDPAAGRWFVADAAGSGTTLLAAGPGVALDPHFGPGSATAHRTSGALPVEAAVPSLRLDVDTVEDLDRARAFGLGARTAAELAVQRT